MALAQGNQLFSQLHSEFSTGKADACLPLLAQLKVLLIQFPSLPPAGLDSNTSSQERELARKIFEIAVLLSVQTNDTQSFQRHMAQLKPYYSEPSNADGTEMRRTMNGLNLMFLLVENRLAEFHSELELLSDEERACAQISFAINLERWLMVGSYNNVVTAKSSLPNQHYGFFMELLLDTVRESIAECSEVAYKSLSVSAAREMMMFTDDQRFQEFIADSHADSWVVSDGRINFEVAKGKKSQEIPSMRLISETLSYATEMERIV